MKRLLASFSILAFVIAVSAFAAESPKLDGVTCPLSGKPVVADQHMKFKEGELYFCCPNCAAPFRSKIESRSPEAAEATAKGNRQLVQTGQYAQKACPMTGKPVAEKTGKNPEIGFCCKNCLGKYDKASDGDKLALVFGEDPFKKGFEPKKAEAKR